MSSKIEAKVTHRFKATAEQVYDAWLSPVQVRSVMESKPGIGAPTWNWTAHGKSSSPGSSTKARRRIPPW
jgi:hypothetical protein